MLTFGDFIYFFHIFLQFYQKNRGDFWRLKKALKTDYKVIVPQWGKTRSRNDAHVILLVFNK